jgi:hypothetical protein
MKSSEELKTHAAAMSKAMGKEPVGDSGEEVTRSIASRQAVDEIINEWGNVATKAAENMIAKYHLPNEAMQSRLIWYNNGPWKRTIVYRDEIPHNFPAPHVDVLEQVINYKIPVEKVSDLAAFDGSVIVERTKGEVAARCDLEAANIVSLNLMHEIVTGKRTVTDARDQYAESIMAYLMDRDAPYAEKLLFDLPQGDTIDMDETNMSEATMHQISEKMKDKLGR